ncbi:MAG: hypothetical protein QG620_764 [Patescibacteria group bacterium]|nr:hypothetical protein [Patescibacteria group bacterium]
MFSFDFGKNIFFGLDIGTSAIKAVELELVNGKPFLSNYAWMPSDNLQKKSGAELVDLDLDLPRLLKRIIKEAKFRGKDAYVSIPASAGLITLIDFPAMADEDMEQAIRFEAHKYIPMPLDDVVLSWDKVEGETSGRSNYVAEKGNQDGGQESVSDDKVKVMLVAASKKKVIQYEKLVKDSGLRLRALETESFSMVNSLIGNDLGTFMIVDIGARICNIILVEKGAIKLNRNMDAGGRDITMTISKSMGVDEEGAEMLKVSKRNFFSRESNINFPTLSLISGEVLRMLQTYYKKDDPAKARVDSIVLSGGTAGMTGIAEYFQSSLGIKTVIGNPLARINYNKKLDPVIDKIKTRFSVSLGLALRGIDACSNIK